MSPINISTSTAISWWRPAAWLRVEGADAAAFLQGQFTNDLRGLAAGGAVYGLWLNVKGKVVADSFVLRRSAAEGDVFWIGSYFSAASTIQARLESYVIADDVTIADATDERAAVTIFGLDAEAASAIAAAEGFVFSGRRGREPSIEWVFPLSHEPAMREKFSGARELDPVEIARRRIGARIPAVPADIGPGDLPNEGALEADAISYTKGCYLGQEVMARLKSMGQVRRRLLRVRSSVAPAALPAPLFVGEKQGGELRSLIADGAGGFVGLALVSLLAIASATTLALAPGGDATVQLLDAP
ncbi:MAG TPA: folate-binding protein [Opitutaceae bacterium]|nr:folate-binding protein [Opitutaceae bacterium]